MADPMLTRELKSLHEELAAAQRARQSPSQNRAEENAAKPIGAADATPTAKPATPPEAAADEQELRGDIREFIDEVTTFFDEAEKNIAAHPAASVVGALVVGILIGRLIGHARS